MRTLASLALVPILALATGCEDIAAPPKQPQAPAQAAQPQAPAEAQPPEVPKPAEMIRQKAAVGMGQRGRDYEPGIVATPVKALWTVEEQIALLQIENALHAYKALDLRGRGPATDEEFMDKIVKANRIKLPPLPPGQRYVYDPAKEELMVEQPKQP